MAEYKLPTTANCEVLIHLVRECKLTLGACIDVAKTNDDIDQAKNLLTQQCPICFEAYTRNEVSNLSYVSVIGASLMPQTVLPRVSCNYELFSFYLL